MTTCKCCETTQKLVGRVGNVRCYNRVPGSANKWARANGEYRAEYTHKVVGGKKFGGPQWIKDACGDGQFGFATRHKTEPVKMTVGLDGQYKWDRKTCVRPKSARSTFSRRARQIWGNKCGITCDSLIAEISRDPIEVKERRNRYKQMGRRRNRNYAARRGINKWTS